MSNALSVFVQRFMLECSSLLRSHVLSRGGNAAIGLRYEDLRILDSGGKGHYAILSVSADVVKVIKIDR